MNTLTTVGIVVGILAGIYAILAGIEARTGSRVLRWVVVPFVRLWNWFVAPRRDIKEVKLRLEAQRQAMDVLHGALESVDTILTANRELRIELKADVSTLQRGLQELSQKLKEVEGKVPFDYATLDQIEELEGKVAEVDSKLTDHVLLNPQVLSFEDETGGKHDVRVLHIVSRLEVLELWVMDKDRAADVQHIFDLDLRRPE